MSFITCSSNRTSLSDATAVARRFFFTKKGHTSNEFPSHRPFLSHHARLRSTVVPSKLMREKLNVSSRKLALHVLSRAIKALSQHRIFLSSMHKYKSAHHGCCPACLFFPQISTLWSFFPTLSPQVICRVFWAFNRPLMIYLLQPASPPPKASMIEQV